MQLQKDHNESPTAKAKPKVVTKNEIQEMAEKQFSTS